MKRHTYITILVGILTLSFIAIVSAKDTYADTIHYTITYNSGVVENMPTDQNSQTLSETVPISSTTPARSGFSFLGWCNQLPTSSDSTNLDTCSGTTFASNSDWTINQTSTSNNLHLYAMWQKDPITIANATYMQEVESCPATLAEEQVYTIKDSRDNQEYKVAKLKDGKCWMVENLNLAGGTALSADDTDVTSDYISNYNLPASFNITKSGNTLILPSSSGGFSQSGVAYIYNTGNKTSNCPRRTGCYSYYSWYAATIASRISNSPDNTDTLYSICPKGWKLPSSYTTTKTNWQTTSDFYVLAHQYGLDSTTSVDESDNGFYTQAGPNTIPNFLLAGYDTNDDIMDQGSIGCYWSSTTMSQNPNALCFENNNISSASNNANYLGLSVRCLLRD